jgi:hypothetical protein
MFAHRDAINGAWVVGMPRRAGNLWDNGSQLMSGW